jgi:hypothetical protein
MEQQFYLDSFSPWQVREESCADTCIASVEAAAVMGGMGLKFIGVVKTVTKRYPMGILFGRELSRREERVSQSCEIN